MSRMTRNTAMSNINLAGEWGVKSENLKLYQFKYCTDLEPSRGAKTFSSGENKAVGLGKGGSSIPVMKRKAQEGKEGAGLAKRAAFGDLTNARSD